MAKLAKTQKSIGDKSTAKKSAVAKTETVKTPKTPKTVASLQTRPEYTGKTAFGKRAIIRVAIGKHDLKNNTVQILVPVKRTTVEPAHRFKSTDDAHATLRKLIETNALVNSADSRFNGKRFNDVVFGDPDITRAVQVSYTENGRTCWPASKLDNKLADLAKTA